MGGTRSDTLVWIERNLMSDDCDLPEFMIPGTPEYERNRRIDEIAEAMRGNPSFGDRCNLVRRLYRELEPRILDAARSNSQICPYSVSWDDFWRTSPPEFGAWWSIRSYGLPLYPQYPVGRWFVDFGDPYRKIALEVDGAEHHDIEADSQRDG